MSDAISLNSAAEQSWYRALSLSELESAGVKMRRIKGRQIAFFMTSDGVRACDNRCPHEGYPLSEGSLSADCILTCNWHNWKFDLANGDNLLGGDRLRTYPIELRDSDIWIEIVDPPYEQQYQRICQSLREAFDDYSYDRIAREIARLIKLDADPLDVLRLSIHWSWQRLEFGWTHAYAGMADWITLFHEHADDRETQLVCLVESVTHVAFDVLREPDYPYAELVSAFDESRFLEAVESEDEAAALAAIRGGIRDGLEFADFERALSRAALAHYNDFGHSLIYVSKAGQLIKELGAEIMAPVLLSLVRSLVFATREDKIPEFRAYGVALQEWGNGRVLPATGDWHKKSIDQSMQATLDCSQGNPGDIYHALLMANARNMLAFDTRQQDKVHISVSGNVGWLDFTHGITFANAVRQQCTQFPELWPAGLLQMACFNGRNSAFTLEQADLETWSSSDQQKQLSGLLEQAINHDQSEHIVSVHLLKVVVAVREEVALLGEEDARVLLAATNRFFNSTVRLRQPRRTAHQSLQFVARE